MGKRELRWRAGKTEDRDKAGFSVPYFFSFIAREGRGPEEEGRTGKWRWGRGRTKVAQPKSAEKFVLWSWGQTVRTSQDSVIATILPSLNETRLDQGHPRNSRGKTTHSQYPIHTRQTGQTMAARDSAKSTLYVGMESRPRPRTCIDARLDGTDRSNEQEPINHNDKESNRTNPQFPSTPLHRP